MLPLTTLLLLFSYTTLARAGLYERLFGSPSSQHVLSSDPSPRAVRGFVSLGDSYSAGIGTPFEGKENDCRQGNGAYPFLLASDLLPPPPSSPPNDNITSSSPSLFNNNNTTQNTTSPFQWLSCTGSTTADILSGTPTSQIDAFNLTPPHTWPDFATLSVGGNDLGFFDVMNACIFRFYSFYSGTCEAALAASDAAIRSPDFDLRLGLIIAEILNRARWELRPRFVVTVTGYARFFDAETEACDDVSLGVWWGGTVPGVVRGPRLKRETRRRMNELVLAVNEKIRGAVEAVNARFATPRALFVDFDREFEGHRFCEQGVVEPDYERNETWFFLPGGLDNGKWAGDGGDGDDRNGTAVLLEEGSPLVDPRTCLPAAEKSGDWGEKALCYMAMAMERDPTLRLKEGMVAPNSMWYVPTYYGKTFHPRSLGHEVIRDKIYEVWRENGVGFAPQS